MEISASFCNAQVIRTEDKTRCVGVNAFALLYTVETDVKTVYVNSILDFFMILRIALCDLFRSRLFYRSVLRVLVLEVLTSSTAHLTLRLHNTDVIIYSHNRKTPTTEERSIMNKKCIHSDRQFLVGTWRIPLTNTHHSQQTPRLMNKLIINQPIGSSEANCHVLATCQNASSDILSQSSQLHSQLKP